MASDPWARFDSLLERTRPKQPASPWARFDAKAATVAGPGPWGPTASPLVQRRRLPDGTYEERPTPREGQEAAVTPATKPVPTAASGTRQVLTRAAEGIASMGDLVNLAVEPIARATKWAAPPRNPGEAFAAHAQAEERAAPMGDVIYGDLAGKRQQLRDAYEAEREKTAEMLRDTPVFAAVSDATLDLVSDPTNLIPGGAGKVALREVGEEALQRAAREAASLTRPADLVEYTAEELADLAARKRGLSRLRPEDIERTLPETPAPRRLGAGIPDAEIEQRLGMRASPEDAEELRRLVPEEGPPSPPRTFEETAPEARRLLGIEDTGPWGRFDEEVARAAPPRPGGSAVDHMAPSGGTVGGGLPESIAPRPNVVEIPRPEPRGTAVTERGQRIDFDYEVRDASTLVTSHDDVLRPNPLYPPEVQPRERARATSAAQVVRIEQQLNPELLGVSPRVSDGAPFIGPDGVVESGNARSIAVRRAYAAGSPQSEGYRAWLRETAPSLGLDPAAVDAVPNPMLVRVRRTAVDRPSFAREANESAVSGFSAAERAAADANLVTPGMLDSLTLQADGSVNLQTNRDFIRAFAAQVAPTEHAAMFDARGQLSLDGERRLQNAILAKAYGDPAAVAKLTEHADSNVRAVGSALMREAPRFARMREGVAAGRLYPLDISEDVAAALRKLSALRDDGMKVSDYLDQGSLFGSDLSPEARTLLVLFDANARSGSRVADILGRYADSVAALGDPAQARMFGEQSLPSRLDLLTSAAPSEQRALLTQAEASYTAVGGAPPAQAAQAVLPPPRASIGGGLGPPPQGDLPGIPSPSETPFRMSTKGIENSAGMQDDLRRVVEANRPEIAAARGPVVPVSQWHDAPALAEKLGLTPDDYLAMPPGRTFSTDEHALGRHYLGNMKQEAKALEARIAAGDVPDMAAAQAEKTARNRDVVRMMAKLQGQGSSEFGRGMRSLQEALDPYGLAETPRDRLQLALLKKYKEANASEAARLETAAVARLKRQAARETRKAARASTAEELSAELGELAAQFGSLSRRPRGMGGGIVPLDPELVEVVGRMAANRVRAGVVAVEELVDQVYTVAARQMDGLSREQVKAAIVEHALAGKAQPKLSPEEARLRRAEAATARSIEQLKKQIAAPTHQRTNAPTSPWSAKLGELKARQADLRQQLEALKVKPPGPDPAAAKLRQRESALARQVEKAEEQLAAGPRVPEVKAAPVDSPRLQELRKQLADVRGQIAADPKQGLAQRYRELLDDETVEMIAALPDPTEDSEALVNFLRQMEKPTFRDFRTTYWINSILSGTKTTMRNLTGNVVRLVELTAMRPAGAVAEQGLARVQGRQAQRYVREALPATMGVFRGVPEGMRRFIFVMREGYDPGRLVRELTEGGASKFDQPLPVNPFLLSQNRGIRALGVPLTLPTRILEATDAMAKVMASTSEMYASATRTAIREGLAGDRLAARVADLVADPTDEMVEAADAFARKATYQDPSSWVGNMAASIRRGPPGADELAAGLRAKGGVGNRLAAGLVQAPQTIGQHLLPFIHISDRVAASITDYIPLSKPFKLAREISGQTPEAADLIARQVVGAGLGMLGITWAAEGKLVGGAPKDEKLRNDFYAEGKQPYSLLVGGRWLPIRDTLGPWAGPLVAAAMYNDHLRAGEDPSPAIQGMALGSARYMLDASYLATLQGVMDAVNGEGGQAGGKLESAGARVVAGYVPFSGLVRNAAVASDPRVVDKEGFTDELKAGIPGLRQQLPAKIGTLGEELVQATGRAGGFSPVVPTHNRVANPGLAEDAERMRATLAEKRREVGRIEASLKDALKPLQVAEKSGKKPEPAHLARVQELRQSLPFTINEAGKPVRVTTARLDEIMEGIRTQEMRIRKLRASGQPEDVIRRGEIEIQKRMAQRLEKALAGL